MSDIPTTERDAAGRFVKTEADAVPPADQDTVHPMATVLFGWVNGKTTPMVLLGAVLIVSLGLVAADLLVSRPTTTGPAGLTGFFGLVGFVSVIGAVFIGWPIGRLLRRPADFYGEGDPTPLALDNGEPSE